jgi:CBS domain containing-hemolysin-like protein
VWFLSVSTNAILRLMGIDPNEADEQVNEEEILMMVDAGSEKGAIDEQEKEFIQNVFEFDDLTAEEIAVHRTEVTFLWMEDPMEEWGKTIHDSRHTLYPVCDGSPDNIVGILNAKDYFRLEDRSREMVMEELFAYSVEFDYMAFAVLHGNAFVVSAQFHLLDGIFGLFNCRYMADIILVATPTCGLFYPAWVCCVGRYLVLYDGVGWLRNIVFVQNFHELNA